jgi:hypothetical protein
MALSGSTDFDLNARQVIRFALAKINIVAEGEPVPDLAPRGAPAIRLARHARID